MKKTIEQQEKQNKLSKKYDKLMQELLKLEKQLKPRYYNYRLFFHDGQKYIKFHPDVVYPLTILEDFIRSWRKQDVFKKSSVIGLTLVIEGLKGIKKSALKTNGKKLFGIMIFY